MDKYSPLNTVPKFQTDHNTFAQSMVAWMKSITTYIINLNKKVDKLEIKPSVNYKKYIDNKISYNTDLKMLVFIDEED